MNTPMAAAILKLFGNLGSQLADRRLPAGSIRAYIFGGCAVHVHTNGRTSVDVDAEFAYEPMHKEDLFLVLDKLPPVYYTTEPSEGISVLAYDPNFNTTLGPLHEDYQKRAVCIEMSDTSPVSVWLPGPEDLALTKLGRMNETDVEDILQLLSLPGSSFEVFEKLSLEAGKYYVGGDLTGNIAYVKSKLHGD